MSRFILGDCVRVMATFPDNAVDLALLQIVGGDKLIIPFC